MKRLTFFLAALATLGGVVAFRAPASGQTDAEAAPSYGVKIPPGYRDWRLISVAHEEGNPNRSARHSGQRCGDQGLPGREASVPGRRHQAFGRLQSFVAGPPKNGVQFMVKDSRKYASTGGWGFAQFNDGKPADEAGAQHLLFLPRGRQSS